MAQHPTVSTSSSVLRAKRLNGSHGAAANYLLRSSKVARGAVTVPVRPSISLPVMRRRPKVSSLVKRVGQLVAHLRETGKTGGFTVIVDARGRVEFGPVQQSLAAGPTVTDDGRLETALKAARDRGRLRSTQILNQNDMLTAEEFANRLGVSRMTVNLRRRKNELLALDGAKRGFRFPAWQVDDHGKALDGLPKLFDLLGSNSWAVYRFLTQRHAVLAGVSAKDALLQGKTKQVLRAAESLAQGDFG